MLTPSMLLAIQKEKEFELEREIEQIRRMRLATAAQQVVRSRRPGELFKELIARLTPARTPRHSTCACPECTCA